MAKRKLKLCGKFIACCLVFTLVLSTGLVSKAAIFFVTSSIGQQLKELSPRRQHGDAREEDYFQNPERVASWMCSLFFTFAVRELFAFSRSLHACLSCPGCYTRPGLVDFAVVFLLETAQVTGMAFLFGSVLPCLSMVHGILLTSCLYLMPALFNLLSRKPDEPKRRAKMTMDGFAFLAQLSGCLHWIFIRRKASTVAGHSQRIIDCILPASLILVSLGRWENYIEKEASIGLIRSLGCIKENVIKSRAFIQIFVSLWNVLVFLGGLLTLTGVLLTKGFLQFCSSAMSTDWNSPFYIFIIQSVASLLFHWFGNIACKIGAQKYCLVLPSVLMTPLLLSAFTMAQLGGVNSLPTHFPWATDGDHDQLTIVFALSSIWFLSKIWINLYIWEPADADSAIGDPKWYNSLLIEETLSLSTPRGRGKEIITSSCSKKCNVRTRIFAVATMWHETSDEMLAILRSIFQMDEDQLERWINYNCNKAIDPHRYHYETHIFFDDAFDCRSTNGTTSKVVNRFVNDFIAMVDKVTFECTNSKGLQPPIVSVTPYGGRLEWILPGKTKMAVHLKDKAKIRIKKRWSQVMYIDYLIRYEMAKAVDMDNTFLLSLDGDMDFRPKAVHTLVDVMNSQRDVAVVCNRSHPTGSAGAMVWYQMFEYAIGFWLLKPSEDLLGSILCASGCFSLIRAKVLLDEEITAKFTALSEKAHHMIQRDQGEDRWLCTLLIKRGYRLAYCASSYAYTHCPETFEEFYNQRRRWALSLIANTVDVLWDCRQIVKINPNVSWLYIVFQALLLTVGLLCPGSIFVALVHISANALFLNLWISFAGHSALILIFIVTCFTAPIRLQLGMAKCLTALYGLILAAAIVHGLVALADDSGTGSSWSLYNLFFLLLASFIFLAGCLHPREIHCLLAGPVYLLLAPSMSILLILYSVINMNVISWGTRDSSSSEIARPLIMETVTPDTKNHSNAQWMHNEIDVGSVMAAQMPENSPLETTVSIMIAPEMANENDSNTTSCWNLDTDVSLSKPLQNVKCLSEEENGYWNDLITSKLFPVPERSQEHKERISTDSIRLRNLSFTCFFLLNSLFAALIFGMPSNSDISVSQKLNSSSIHQVDEMVGANGNWFLQTNPMQTTLVFLAGLMLVIQFTALLISRVDNLTRLLSSEHFTFFHMSLASIIQQSALSDEVVLTDFNRLSNQNGEHSVPGRHAHASDIHTISEF